jgi:S1-C subfamily serine protease
MNSNEKIREMTKLVFWVTALWVAFISILSYAVEVPRALKSAVVQFPTGSGAVVEAPSGKKYALTNWHVCESSVVDKVIAITYQDGTTLLGKPVKVLPAVDLCAIEVPKTFASLKVATDEVKRGVAIYTRGYPERILTESSGTIKSTESFQLEFPPFAKGCPEGFKGRLDVMKAAIFCTAKFTNHVTSLYSQPGSSGSAVVNKDGELVGVIQTYKESDGAGVIPFETVKEFLKDL